MRLLYVAGRVAARFTRASPIELFRHLTGLKPEEAVTEAWQKSELDDDQAREVCYSAIEKVYGAEIAAEVRQASEASNRLDPVFCIHELMHKIIEPEFILETTVGRKQTSRSMAEAVIDEVIISYLGMTEKDNTLQEQLDGGSSALIDEYKTPEAMLEAFEVPMSDPRKSKLGQGVARKFRREGYDPAGPEYEDEEGEELGFHNPQSPYKDEDELRFVADKLMSYIAERMESFSRDYLEQGVEAKFKTFLNLFIRRLGEPSGRP